MKEEEPVEDGKCNEDKGKADGGKRGAWQREKDVNKMVEKQEEKEKRGENVTTDCCLGRCRGRREEEEI